MNDTVTNMAQMSGSERALIIAAILSLFGVLIGVSFNFISNIKTNKAQREAEEKRAKLIEKKAKLSYQKELMDKLFEVYKELQDNEVVPGNKKKEKIKEEIGVYTAFALKKMKQIEPFLMKSDRDKLFSRYEEIQKNRGELQKKMYFSDFSDEDYEMFHKLVQEDIALARDFKKVLSNEMTIISDAIRNQMDVL